MKSSPQPAETVSVVGVSFVITGAPQPSALEESCADPHPELPESSRLVVAFRDGDRGRSSLRSPGREPERPTSRLPRSLSLDSNLVFELKEGSASQLPARDSILTGAESEPHPLGVSHGIIASLEGAPHPSFPESKLCELDFRDIHRGRSSLRGIDPARSSFRDSKRLTSDLPR